MRIRPAASAPARTPRRGRPRLTGLRLPRAVERALLALVWTGLLLLLLTPFVVIPSIVYPYVVGKALFSRAVIEIVFVAWTALAVCRPRYRPPPSAVLYLYAAALGVAALAAVAGVAPARSAWSSLERMQGVVDAAHWFAAFCVLAGVVRTARAWRLLLNAALGAALSMAAITVCEGTGIGVPFYGDLPFASKWVITPLGNRLYLGAYLLVGVMLAVGFLAESFVRPATPETAGRERRGARGAATRNAARAFWAACIAVGLWAVGLAHGTGPLLGLGCAAGSLALAWAILAATRTARAVAAGIVATAVAGGCVAVLGFFEVFGRQAHDWFDQPLVRELFGTTMSGRTVQTRLAAWQAGLEGFADHPLLGWGPESFVAVFMQHATDLPRHMETHDYAHGQLVEELATKGLIGAAAYLGLWAAAFAVLGRAVRRLDVPGRVVPLAAGAALVGCFVQSQFLFPTTAGSLQVAFLLAFVAHLGRSGEDADTWGVPEAHGRTGPHRSRGPTLRASDDRAGASPSAPREASPRRLVMRATVCAAAVAGAGLGLWSNAAIHVTARDVVGALANPALAESLASAKRAVAAFGPFANDARALILPRLEALARDANLRRHRGVPEALVWGATEARVLLASRPINFRHRATAAQYLAAAAEIDPVFLEDARREVVALLEAARGQRGALATLPEPGIAGAPRVRRLSPGRHEAQWPPAPGALFYRLSGRPKGGRWQTLHEGVERRVVVTIDAPKGGRYRVRGCVAYGKCGRWSKTTRLGRKPRR